MVDGLDDGRRAARSALGATVTAHQTAADVVYDSGT
jgi:hypothetical protein